MKTFKQIVYSCLKSLNIKKKVILPFKIILNTFKQLNKSINSFKQFKYILYIISYILYLIEREVF